MKSTAPGTLLTNPCPVADANDRLPVFTGQENPWERRDDVSSKRASINLLKELRPFLSPSVAALIACLICVIAVHRYVITFAFVVLCIYAVLGPKQAIKALSLNYLILFLNPSIQVLPAEAGIMRWVILFIAGIRVLPAVSSRSFRFLVPLLLFFTMVAALSWVISPNLAISFLKLTVFTYCAATVLIAFNTLNVTDLEELRAWFLTISAAVFLLSLPTFAIPKVGFHTNGHGFQGIFNHPQALGIFLAPTAAYFGAGLLLRSSKQGLLLWGAWGFVMAVMFLTRARTAMLTFFLSMATTLVAGNFSSKRELWKLAPVRALIAVAVASTVLAAGIFISPAVSNKIEGFWLKGEEHSSVEESFYRSRGAGIAFYWNRFLKEPLTGNGFGIDVAHGFEKNPATFLGIPISASTEKGFLPVALLEEVGLLGLAFILPFLFFLTKGAMSQADIGLMAMFFACFFVNIGEAVFFSPGSLGGYFWLLIGLASAMGWNTTDELQSNRVLAGES